MTNAFLGPRDMAGAFTPEGEDARVSRPVKSGRLPLAGESTLRKTARPDARDAPTVAESSLRRT